VPRRLRQHFNPQKDSMSQPPVSVRLTQQQDYQFAVQFAPQMPLLHTDEPAPLGQGTGPSPVELLAAAVGNCLSDSLLFALRKYKQKPEPIVCEVQAEVARNEQGRMRVQAMYATLHLGVPAAELEHLERVLVSFESYCTVTQSVAQAFPVQVQVLDALGAQLK
jgi:uncharacterized OsmC-like protein